MKITLGLIIDDGVPSRGHRENIYNPDFNHIGVGHGPHKGWDLITTMDFAGGVGPKGSAPSSGSKAVSSSGGSGGIDMKAEMEKFMKEPYDFDMGDGVKSYSDSINCETSGNTAKRTITRKIEYFDGRKKTCTKTQTRTFS